MLDIEPSNDYRSDNPLYSTRLWTDTLSSVMKVT